jgi:hypothetical protein
MGISHILTVSNDALERLRDNDHREIAADLGQQVYKLCLAPGTANTPERTERITFGPIANHANAVNWVGNVHSTENHVYLWAGNCLRALRELETEDLRFVLQAAEEELRKRGRDR